MTLRLKSFVLPVLFAAIVAWLYERALMRAIHPGFGIRTSAALRRTCWWLRFSHARYDVIAGDIDRMKTLNSGPEGYALTDRLIAGAFHELKLRRRDVKLIAAGKEGDEFAVVIRQERKRTGNKSGLAEGGGAAVAERLRIAMQAQPLEDGERARLLAASGGTICGLSATMAVWQDVPACEVLRAVELGLERVLAAKGASVRGQVLAPVWWREAAWR